MQPAQPHPTRVRRGVLLFACTLSMITYLDRVAIASAAGDIVRALGLQSVADLKWAFTAIALAYALFEVPTGWMGDMFGPRRALLRIVLWWSAFTVLTAAVGLKIGPVVLGLGFLIGVRLLFGVGEAGAYPNLTRALHNWLPLDERGRGQGLVWSCGKLMGGLTPFLWTVLVVGAGAMPALLGWRGAFCLFGFIGVAWCVLFARWFRDRPEQKPVDNFNSKDPSRTQFYVSRDQGRSFTPLSKLGIKDVTFSEHMAVERKDGSILMMARTSYGIAQAQSFDRGATWVNERSFATERGVNTRFFLRKLKSGALLLVVNDVPRGRSHLTAMLSEDDGKTWPH